MTHHAQFRVEGKVAVVTGALGRLGGIWTKALLDGGASVAALDLPGIPIPEPMRKHLEQADRSRLCMVEADVTSRASLERAADLVRTRFGNADVLVNNAGIDAPPDPHARTFTLVTHDAGLMLQTFNVNVVGAFLCAQVFGAPMLEQRRGSIINIGSLYASVSPDARFYEHFPTDPPFLKPPGYGASKAALVNLTRYLATHWGPSGVRVNALSPGGVEGGQDAEFKRRFTARVPLGRMCELPELAGPLLFLASDSSSYVTGIELVVDGGFTAW